jgi:hypothetical protein
MISIRLLILIGSLFIIGCATKVATTGTGGGDKGKYAEDLSVLRPKIPTETDTTRMAVATTSTDKGKPSKYVEAKYAVNESLDAVLDSIRQINLANGNIDGFTIQVYSGIRREEALSVKKQLSSSLPGLNADVQYVQPNFRVRAGKYFDRVQAQEDYLAVKRYFPNAIVIPDRISIR